MRSIKSAIPSVDSPGASNPLPVELRFIPGESLLNDESDGLLTAASGDDVVFLDSRVDTPMTNDANGAIFLEIDPTWSPLQVDFSSAR